MTVSSPQQASQLKPALRIAWCVLSLIILAALIAPFVVPSERLHHLFPPCPSRALFGRPCPTCGMTTAFIHISRGEFAEASRANRFSLPLYGMFWSNELAALVFFARRLRGASRGRRA